MDKQALEQELNSIFKLFKACTDRSYLVKLCEDKGLIVNASHTKEAEEHESKFASVFSNLIDIGASNSLKAQTIISFGLAFDKIAGGSTRPKTDPTFDAVEKILRDNKKDLQKKFNVGKIWDKGFIIELAKKYGEYDKDEQVFLNKDGQKLLSLKGLGSIQDTVKFMVNDRKRAIPRGWDDETVVDNILMYIFYPENSESLFDVLDKNLEKANKEGNLPVEMTGLIVNFVKNHIENYFRDISKKQFATDGQLQASIEELEELKRKLELAKTPEAKETIENKIENKLKQIKTIQNKLDNQKSDLDVADLDGSVIPKHKFVEMDLSSSGEEIHHSPSDVEHIVDVKDALKLLIEKDLVDDFSKFLKGKADATLNKIYNLIIEDDELNISKPAEIVKVLQDAKITPKEIAKSGQQLKKYLADYANDKNDEDLLMAMDKYNLLPKSEEIKLKKKKDEGKKKSSIEECVDGLESVVYAMLNHKEEEKAVDGPDSKIARIISYIDLLSTKL